MSRQPTTTVNNNKRQVSNFQTSLNDLTKLSHQIQEQKEPNTNNEQLFSFSYFGIFDISRTQITKLLSNIKFILIMGSASRAQRIAKKAYQGLKLKEYLQIGDVEKQTFRIFKIDDILCCNHGMGFGSVALFMNELIRLMSYANNLKFQLVRLGSSGGIGVPGGTLVISTGICDAVTLKPEWTFVSCGEEFHQECIFDQAMAQKFHKIAAGMHMKTEFGKTVSAESFYEAQSRLDGSLCEFNAKTKLAYLNKLYSNGVRNFEMEGNVVCGMCTKHEIRCAMICVAYLNRLKGDTIDKQTSIQERDTWMQTAIAIVLQYIKYYILGEKEKQVENK